MFFMHPVNENLKHRSLFFSSVTSSSNAVFRRDATEDDIYKKWEAEKGELTNDFKRKSRAARKKNKKIQRSSNKL
jgi:hypothetical protein